MMTYFERMKAVREDKDLKQNDVAQMLNTVSYTHLTLPTILRV